jgi:hypothetical protein
MPRTFSLARLMVWITALCVVLGVIATYPEVSVAYLMTLLLLAPTGIAILTLVHFAKARGEVLACSALGATLFAVSSPIYMGHSPRSFVEGAWGLGIPYSCNAFLGALLIGAGALVLEAIFGRFSASNDEPRD